MNRNIGRLSRRTFFLGAFFLMAACLLISLLPRAASDPVQSAKSVLQSIPLYPGATQIYREDTDTPGSQINHQSTFCSIECARLKYQAPDRPQTIINFYENNAALDGWRPWGDVYVSPPAGGRSYQYGPAEFKSWSIVSTDSGFPWIHARHDMHLYYLLDIRTEEKILGITNVELIVRRRATMPSDTPIPTLVPPPPTAPLPFVPGSMKTQEPNIPFPLPTAP